MVRKFYKLCLKRICISDSFPRIILIGDIKKMSVHTPPTLQKRARQTQLRDEALAISPLENVPAVYIPWLFQEAFAGRHNSLIKTMVAAWPFPCLPVGPLIKKPNLETLQALLDGVDRRLTRKFPPG